MTVRKSASKVRVLIPTGNGSNCEDETAYIYRDVLRASVSLVHMNDILRRPSILRSHHVLDLVGGFADGDHINSGKIQANRLRFGLGDELQEFISDGKLIIGVCNGFQTLVKAGILPGFDGDYTTQRVTLMLNDSGRFWDSWVQLRINTESNCVWTKGMEGIYLPIRHGEGKLRAEKDILGRLSASGQIVVQYIDPSTGTPTMQYPHNPNGSELAIAGICDPTGRVFGMMPHREAFWSPLNHPIWTRLKIEGKMPKEGAGIQVSRNAIKYVMENLV